MAEPVIPEFDESLGEDSPFNVAPVPYQPISTPGASLSSQEKNQFPLGVPSAFYQPNALSTQLTEHAIPFNNLIEESKGKPGWWETMAHNFSEYNLEIQAGVFTSNQLFGNNPLADQPQEDFNAYTPEAVEGFPVKYWRYLVQAQSPMDLQMRQKKLKEQMEQDEYFDSGSWSAKLLGGIGGSIISPTTLFLMPEITSLKFAGVAQSTLANASRAFPAVAVDAFARNSFIQANRTGGSLEEAGINTLIDSAFGVALIGAGSGLKALNRNYNLWHTRKAQNFAADGIGFGYEIAKDGTLRSERPRAYPMGGASVNAAQVNAAQAWSDSVMAKPAAFRLPGAEAVIDKLYKIPGTKWLQSPAIQAAQAKYEAQRTFFHKIAGSPFITEGESQGVASADSAQLLADIYASHGMDFVAFNRDAFYRANGIEGSWETARALKNFTQAKTNNRQLSEEQFTQEIRSIIEVEGYKSKWSQAHEVADKALEMMDNINRDYARVTGKELFADPKTAFKYLPNDHNVSLLKNREEIWKEITYAEVARQDQLIENAQKPLKAFEERIKSLESLVRATNKKDPRFKSYENQLRSTRGQLKQAQNALHDMIDKNPDLKILLEDRVPMTLQERKELERLHEPLNEVNQGIKNAKDSLDKVNKELSSLKRTKENKLKREKLSIQKKEYEDELKLANKELEKRMKELEDAAYMGELNKKHFTYEGDSIKLKDPLDAIKFRATHENENDRWNTVNAWYESVTQTSPQDLVQRMFGNMPEIPGSPSYTKQRKIYIPSNVYTKTGFFNPDIGKTMMSYMQAMGREIAFKHTFPEYANERGFEGMLKGIKQEHDIRRAALLDKPPSKERDIEISRVDKEFDEAVNHMRDTYLTYMGQYSSHASPKLQASAQILRNLTAGLRLGSIPIYQIADLGGIIMKNGLMPFLSAGMKPLLLSANGHAKGKMAEAYRAYAADAGLAVNTLRGHTGQRLFNSLAMENPPVTGFMEKAVVGTQKFSHLSSNFYGTNYIADLNERLAASTFQSEVMRVAHKFIDGTATASELEKMAHYGIDMNRWAKTFVKNMKDVGGYKEGKYAYQSMYHLWEDTAAVSRMANSIRRATNDMVLSSNKYASPYWTQHPLNSLVFMFHGWAYNAFNRYTIPLLQRPDAQAALGAVSIVGLSMLAEPLMRLSNGKDAFKDDETWFDTALKGLDYSGFGGPTWELLANINKASGNALWVNQSEKRAAYNGVGAFAGPAVGLLWDVVQLGGHGFKGDITQGDAKKIAHLMPLLNSILTRGAVNTYIEGSGLPPTRRQAEKFGWWNTLHGEQ